MKRKPVTDADLQAFARTLASRARAVRTPDDLARLAADAWVDADQLRARARVANVHYELRAACRAAYALELALSAGQPCTIADIASLFSSVAQARLDLRRAIREGRAS